MPKTNFNTYEQKVAESTVSNCSENAAPAVVAVCQEFNWDNFSENSHFKKGEEKKA